MTPNRSGHPAGTHYCILPDTICGVRAYYLLANEQVVSGPPANMPKTLRNLMTRRGLIEVTTPPQYARDAAAVRQGASEGYLGTVAEKLPASPSRCQNVAAWVIVSSEPGITTFSCDEHLRAMTWDTDEVSPIECTAYAGRVIQCCRCGDVVLTAAAFQDDPYAMPMPDLITQDGGEW